MNDLKGQAGASTATPEERSQKGNLGELALTSAPLPDSQNRARGANQDAREIGWDSSIGKVVDFPASASVSVEQDTHMEKINPYAFYRLGQELQPLTAVVSRDSQIPIREIFFPLWTARMALERLFAGDPIKLDFARRPAAALKAHIEKLFTEHFIDEQGNMKFPPEGENVTIWSWQWGNVTGALTTFQTVFQTEMEKATTYQVSKKGLYSTVDLVELAEETFPADLMPFIPQKARDDFHAAGRCLAFNLPTAAGFHAARGIEGELELYWQTFTKKTGTRHGWQDYIDDLQGLIDKGTKPAPEQRTVKQLGLVKDYDRNPVMHPREAILEDNDARILFSSAESMILAMAQEIKATQGVSSQGALTLVQSGPAP